MDNLELVMIVNDVRPRNQYVEDLDLLGLEDRLDLKFNYRIENIIKDSQIKYLVDQKYH